ncbi:MAG: hypothetical protein NT128_05930 [Proteobacteria bacterium]|nr:hypothetical protein [Pseudomonadota bacterium]
MTYVLLVFLCLAIKIGNACTQKTTQEDTQTLQTYKTFKSMLYNKKLTADLSLLEQITDGTRIGRHTEKLEHFEPVQDVQNYLTNQGDNFDDELDLGARIKQYFSDKKRSGDALYSYFIYQDIQSSACKGIIVNYYGGFSSDFFDSGMLRSTEKTLVKNGYIVIYLQSRDSWQTIDQDEQFSKPKGKELLQDTIMSLFLFTSTVKEQYPSLPVYYKGASFGGAKGALANLILSNKGSLTKVFTQKYQKFAKGLESDLAEYAIDHALFQGYVLHDGCYSDFSKHNILKKYYTHVPMLLLQNFDDERVTVDDALDFYKNLTQFGSKDETLRLFIAPQGAQSFLQKAEISSEGDIWSSLDGHYPTELLKYRADYEGRILAFLAGPKGDRSLLSTLNKVRYTHSQSLFNSNDIQKTALYRLYYAILHTETQTSNVPMLDRLSKTFSQYANHLSDNPASNYKDLVEKHGLWLIESIMNKNKMMYQYFFNLAKVSAKDTTKKTRKYSPAIALESPKPQARRSYEHFYLTENARRFLKSQNSALELIERAKKYSIAIDQRVLNFFVNHKEDPSLADIETLWNYRNLQETENLSHLSRSLSLSVKASSLNKKERARLLEIITPWNPEEILLKLGNKNLKLESYEKIMECLLAKKEENEKQELLSNFADILPACEGNDDVIVWVSSLSMANRQKIVDKYLVIKTLLSKNNLGTKKILGLFQGLSEQDMLALSFEKDVSKFVEDIKRLKNLSKDRMQRSFTKKISGWIKVL